MTFPRGPLGWVIPALWGGVPPARGRRVSQAVPQMDSLESRVVLSRAGALSARAAARLAPATIARADSSDATKTRIARGPAALSGVGAGPPQDEQLVADLEMLRSHVNAAIAGSTVTDAQRLAQWNDLQALAESGFAFERAELEPVVEDLLRSLSDGSYDRTSSRAETNHAAFVALFRESDVAPPTIDASYEHIVAIARNLNLSMGALTALAADRAAVRDDLDRLGITSVKVQSNLDFVLSPGGGRGRI